MAISFVGSAVTQESSGATTGHTVTLPSGIANGDCLLLFVTCTSSGLTITQTAGPTITEVGTAQGANQSGFSTRLYVVNSLLSSHSSTAVTFTSSSSMKYVIEALVFRGNSTSGAVGDFSALSRTSSLTPTTPTIASTTTYGVCIQHIANGRGATTPNSTSWTQPGGFTKPTQGFTSGSVQLASAATAYDLTAKTIGSSVGGSTWTTDAAALGGAWTLILVPAAIPPTCAAGSDQTVTKSTPVTLSGTDADTDGTISGRLWTQTAGPTVSLSGSTTATASFTPSEAGRYVFSYTVTDNSSLTATDSIQVNVTDTTGRPSSEISNAGAWTVTGAADSPTALRDSSDSTYVSSVATPSSATFEELIDPMPTPSDLAGVKVHVRMKHTNAASTSVIVRLVEGTTIVQSWTQTGVTSSFVTYEFAVGATEAGTVTDWKNVRVRVVGTAS